MSTFLYHIKMQAINKMPGLNEKQEHYLYEAYGVEKSVLHYNKTKVEQALKSRPCGEPGKAVGTTTPLPL